MSALACCRGRDEVLGLVFVHSFDVFVCVGSGPPVLSLSQFIVPQMLRHVKGLHFFLIRSSNMLFMALGSLSQRRMSG